MVKVKRAPNNLGRPTAAKPPATAVTGFEQPPQGRLLRQVTFFDRDVGIAYERCIGFFKPIHTHDRVTITFARGSSRSETTVYDPDCTYSLDSSTVHWLAVGTAHQNRALSTVYDTMALYPTVARIQGVAQALGVSRAQIATLLATTVKIPRSQLLADLCDRLFYYRVVAESTDDTLLTSLEQQLLSEVIGALIPAPQVKATALASGAGQTLTRALEFIESKLFEALAIDAVCRAARVSQPTLFRAFRDDLQMTPFAYIRTRRLDEAEALLRTGEYQVADVALLVGYEDLSAFSKACKLQFKRPPSTSLPKT
ncbi:MAG: AraC family transcriptional regulator [Proteobacteria bacterium]|nr:AraC family transcriptional regulator [Pseudomonadota bacterium]